MTPIGSTRDRSIHGRKADCSTGTQRRSRPATCQCDQDRAACCRPITPRWLTRSAAVGAGRGGHLPPQHGQGRNQCRCSLLVAATNATCRKPSSTTKRSGREYMLSAVTTIVDVHTRVSDLYSVPARPDRRAVALTIENDQGEAGKRADQQQGVWLAHQRRSVADDRNAHRPADARRPRRTDRRRLEGAGFFLAHPQAIAAFGRECTRRGVPPATVTLVRFAVPHLARPAV